MKYNKKYYKIYNQIGKINTNINLVNNSNKINNKKINYKFCNNIINGNLKNFNKKIIN